jgi:pSer/pThr/pTyr-binding forkhead associated (FHA) protein
VVTSPGPLCGTVLAVTQDGAVIGRDEHSGLRLDDLSVSRAHARLERRGSEMYVVDLGSTNGTRVNGLPVTGEQMLRFDDRVRFGGIESRFESDVQGSEPLPEQGQIAAAPAEVSAAPVDFSNASPFPNRKKAQDPTRTAIFAGAGIALLVFLISMYAVLTMHPPPLTP